MVLDICGFSPFPEKPAYVGQEVRYVPLLSLPLRVAGSRLSLTWAHLWLVLVN